MKLLNGLVFVSMFGGLNMDSLLSTNTIQGKPVFENLHLLKIIGLNRKYV
jgi:hypothetical protein